MLNQTASRTADETVGRQKPPPARTARGVAPLYRADVAEVVELHRHAFPGNRPREELEQFLKETLLDHPWAEPGLRSLVYRDARGRIVGCIGVMPRPMQLEDRLLRAVVTHNFMVHPDHRRTLAGVALLRAAAALGQDLTLAEGDATSRELCVGMGGVVYPDRSALWVRVLRPVPLAAKLVGRIAGKHSSRWSHANGNGSGNANGNGGGHSDGKGASPDRTRRHQSPDAEALLEVMRSVTEPFRLRPSYSEEALRWLLATLARTRRPQWLRGRIVPGPERQPVGWYLYYSRPGDIGRVLQLGAVPGARTRVLDELFADAAREGNVGVSGPSDPFWRGALRRGLCLPARGKSWILGHSRIPDVARALSSNSAFLSRLEGEGWLRLAF
jgi:hypothetical protein